jgi:penicillin-insensitive murein endopeptidase
MRGFRVFILVLFLGTIPAFAADPHRWGEVETPAPGPAAAIGGYVHGCLRGGEDIDLDGPGYQVIHPSRNRYWGHPDLIDYIEKLGERVDAAGLGPMLVGDMAQPRGGPLSFGHASHQIGLDVDIWYRLDSQRLPVDAREDISLPSMVSWQTQRVDGNHFGHAQISLLRLALQDPRVDRIFVNAAIKYALCKAAAPDDRDWLRRIRPWYGHDDHFHVRLACPATGSPDCEPQAPPPPGDGCTEAVSWLKPPQSEPPPAPPKHGPPNPSLPTACRSVLNAH